MYDHETFTVDLFMALYEKRGETGSFAGRLF
jgi:hypothetical protein